jgi:CheY-like chemotaxis protein
MEAVGTLAGGVAHDFNNMLGVILGHAEMALESLAPAQPIVDSLQTILNTARRSADLTRQLLAFARRQTIAPRVLDLNETIKEMIKMLGRLLGEDIELIWLPEPGACPIKMDPSQIDQILANLCINARDAISGVGRITIETHLINLDKVSCTDHPEYLPGEYVLLSVSDNGCGIDKETMDKIFEPFFTTKKVGKGIGLGLSTVYGIVKQNNAFIKVSSEPGQDTTFKIYLPRQMAADEEMWQEIPVARVAGGNETVLLVEDDPMLLEMTKLMLGTLGYRVLAASTPSEAIFLTKKHGTEIQLLITDVILPEMNSRELRQKLTSLLPAVKVLFISDYTGDVIARQGVLVDGTNFMQKPFSKEALATKVRSLLDSK